jgi:hypothetical protein
LSRLLDSEVALDDGEGDQVGLAGENGALEGCELRRKGQFRGVRRRMGTEESGEKLQTGEGRGADGTKHERE